MQRNYYFIWAKKFLLKLRIYLNMAIIYWDISQADILINTSSEQHWILNHSIKKFWIAISWNRIFKLDDIKNIVVTIIDIRNNKLLAYHGNGPSQSGNFSYVDVAQAPRSYGSLLKPLLYAHALETSTFLPNEMIADIPTAIGDFQPENFDKKYRGAVPLEETIIQSLNVPSARLLNTVGLHGVYDLIKYLDIQNISRKGLIIMGWVSYSAVRNTLWELSRIYKELAQNYSGIADPFRDVQILKQNIPVKSKTAFAFSPFTIDHLIKAMSDLSRQEKKNPGKSLQMTTK